jgi:choline-sulfatase
VVVLAVVLVVVAPGRRASAPPNILLVTLDTTRADRIGTYGYRGARTPRLDRLAAGGVVFERAIAVAPLTLPAHASLFTGLYPFGHGVRNNGNFVLGEGLPTLAAALRDAGYQTGAFVSAFVLDRRYGLARGFDHYDDRFELERRGDRTADAAAGWLTRAAQDRRPFFAWVHLYDPHDPYDPPAPYDGFASPYDGEISFVDEQVGILVDRLDALSLASATIVAVAGDHGESLDEHGEATHGLFVYEAAMRVPVVLWRPGALPSGRRVTPLVRQIDIAPTLLALAGQSALAGAHGQSLVPLIDGKGAAPGSAYTETYFPRLFMNWSALRSIQDDRWKFIDAPVPELYDLVNDPGERANLASREPGRAAALRRALDETTGGSEGSIAPSPVDSETRQKLAALGYIGAATDRPLLPAGSRRPDPKAMIGVFNRLRHANALIRTGRFADVESVARDVLAADHPNAFATMILARAEMEQGKYRDAIAHYRAYAELVPSSADAHHLIAICWSRLGDVDRALGEVEAALGLDPRHAEAHVLRGGLRASRGLIEEAIVDLRAAVDAAPDNAPFRVGLGRILLTAGRLDAADAEVRRALELQPENPDAHAARGAVLAARGQPEAALAAFERALAFRPDADDVRLDFAGILERLGRRTEARREYARLAGGRDTPADIRRAARERLR